MNMLSEPELTELRGLFLELSQGCPLHQDNPEDCPLHMLRKMEPAKRMEWFESLSAEDLRYVAAYHQVCLNVKLGEACGKAPLSPS